LAIAVDVVDADAVALPNIHPCVADRSSGQVAHGSADVNFLANGVGFDEPLASW
jgi:hypothetical protein